MGVSARESGPCDMEISMGCMGLTRNAALRGPQEKRCVLVGTRKRGGGNPAPRLGHRRLGCAGNDRRTQLEEIGAH